MTDPTALPPAPGFTDLRARIQAGETLYGTFAGLGSPTATEMCARAGFDWLIIDLEHGAGHESDVLAHLHAVGTTPTTAIVRPRSGDRLRIGRVLDLGAHGVMIPRIDLPEQAAEAISFTRYPPDGTRGLALSTRGAGLDSAAPFAAGAGRGLGAWQTANQSNGTTYNISLFLYRNDCAPGDSPRRCTLPEVRPGVVVPRRP